MSVPPLVDRVRLRAEENFDRTIERLARYLAIPAISCRAEHHADVARLAAEVAGDLGSLGFRAEVLGLEGALPLVAASWMGAGPDKPTVLIYGHLDLQPVKRSDWSTPPHLATIRGDRLYARGSSDDMGGWVSHLAAVEAWMAEGTPPCNLRLIIEGEEEIGSPNLERYMDAHPEAFEADVMILTDCENPSVEVPGLTVSLRGLLEVELVVEALEADVHSGLWGGMVPDVALALMRLVTRLTDEDGRMAVGRVEIAADRRAAAWGVPLTTEVIRDGAHLRPEVSPLPDRGIPPAEWMWWQPSVTVIATTMPRPEEKTNALRKAAQATLSIRLAPGQTPEEMFELLSGVLLRDPPAGVSVRLIQGEKPGMGWLYAPKGPAFDAADRAYRASWGQGLAQVGVGGSIPFVALFGRRFGDLPLILNGVMDPLSTAHGPNESLHLGLFRKAIAANIHLIDELSRVDRAALRGS